MRTLVMEINDAGLVVADADGVLAIEPGYVQIDNGRIMTGAAALAEARLKPRRTSNRFWAELSVEPDTAGVHGVGRSAELGFAQLGELWARFGDDETEVVFVVPEAYGREQLGVLLGLAKGCGIPVKSLVDGAAAASRQPFPGRQLLYVDAGLHRLSVVPLEQGEEAVALDAHSRESYGLSDLSDSLARWFAELFVRTTRFDPFHRADTEQQLYDHLPEWLNWLRHEDAADIELPHDGDAVTVHVERQQVQRIFDDFNRMIVQLVEETRQTGSALVVQLSERLADLPGLVDALTQAGVARVVGLAPGTAAQGALVRTRDNEAGQSIRLLRHLPWCDPPDSEPIECATSVDRDPTLPLPIPGIPSHVVHDGVAYPLDEQRLVVGPGVVTGCRTLVVDVGEGAGAQGYCELVLQAGELTLRSFGAIGVFVNDEPIDGEVVLGLRDRVRIGTRDVELSVIRVEEASGA